MNEALLTRIADAFPEILSREWLVEGKGDPEVPDRSLRPHINEAAAAGFMDGISEGKRSDEFEYLSFPVVNYDFSIDARGDSMLPRIESGDMLFCRIISDRLAVPLNEICVIDTKEGAAVKIIKSVNFEAETITLHSLNPKFSDYDIDFSSVLHVARVVALTRSFI